MRSLCVVQARMGSSRLPGKVLMPLGGRPMLDLMLARLASSAVDHLVVATSDHAIDDEVARVAGGAGVDVVRGDERDVLDRFALALSRYPADVVVRLTADCPLSDPALVDAVLARHLAEGASYTSNSLVRTFPDGLDVEVVSADVLREAAAAAVEPAEREHVTPYVYRRPDRFRLVAVRGAAQLGHLRWTVDTSEDLDALRALVDQLDDPVRAPWEAIREVAPAGSPPVPWVRPATASDDSVVEEQLGGTPIGRGEPHRPIHVEPDDPSTRSWVVVDDGRVAGWLQVEVHDGVGIATGRLSAALAPRADSLLAQATAGDLQVGRLVYDHDTEDMEP